MIGQIKGVASQGLEHDIGRRVARFYSLSGTAKKQQNNPYE